MVGRTKLAAAHFIALLAAFVVALPSWAQAPIDVLATSEEALTFSFERKVLARAGSVTPDLLGETSDPIEVAQPALEGDFTYVAGWVKCFGSVHNPHKSRDSGTVKAKASGGCVYIPKSSVGSNRRPRQQDLTWTLYLSVASGRASASAQYPKRGYSVLWSQNRGGGTQADTGRCINGFYRAHMMVILTVGGGFFLDGDPRQADDSKWANVDAC